MFDYTDPTGGSLLVSSGALAHYRATLHSQYMSGARHPDSAFTLLSAFSMLSEDRVAISNVPWVAFPRSVQGTDMQIDNLRTVLQDEYVEWRVERDANNKVTRIEFTTEFSEYYEAFAALGFDPLRAASREVRHKHSGNTITAVSVLCDVIRRQPGGESMERRAWAAMPVATRQHTGRAV